MTRKINRQGENRGLIISFYSFKGGVGRSMALANIAVLLARMGKKVLAVDWDLEAPGLDYYFESSSLERNPPNVPGGLLSWLELNTRRNPVGWHDYISEITIKAEGLKFDFLSSGVALENYSQRLANFSWRRYFTEKRGADLLEQLRKDWMQKYEFVLLDSRTGLADTSGVCTIQMPDLLVLTFAANGQNLVGCQQVANAARAGRGLIPYDRPYLTVLPILSRLDAQEETSLATKWMDRVANEFAEFYADWLTGDLTPRELLNWTRIPYLPVHSFGEDIAVLDTDPSKISDPQGVSLYYNIIAQMIANGPSKLKETYLAFGIIKRIELLPSEELLRKEARNDPGFARRWLKKISESAQKDILPALTALERLANFSQDLLPGDAEEILRQSVELALRYNVEQPEETARLFIRHAELLARIGKEYESLARYREASEFVERHFGMTNPVYILTLISQANFRANATSNERSFQKAEELFRKALKLAEETFPSSSPQLAGFLVNFADFLAKVGKRRGDETQKAEGLQNLERAVEIYRVLNPEISDHGIALQTTLNQLYLLLMDLGKYQVALATAQEIIDIVNAKTILDAVALCDALEKKGWALEFLGLYKEAQTIYMTSLGLKEKNWGVESLRYGITCSKLADVLYAIGDYTEAEQFGQRAKQIHERYFGQDSPEAANTYASLADILGVTGRRSEAEKYLRLALKIRLRAFGREDRFVALTYAHLGLLLHEMGKYADAVKYHHLALEIDRRLYGPKHPEVAFDQLNLASALSKQGERRKDYKKWERNLSIITKAFGAKHEAVARKRMQYAEHLYDTGQSDQALPEIRQVIDILKGTLKNGHQYIIDAEKVLDRLQNSLSQGHETKGK